MTNREILEIAMRQSAIDLNCNAKDFLLKTAKVVRSAHHPKARKYLTLPFFCNLVSYGNNVVASVDPAIEDTVRAYLEQYPVEHCFETPNMHVLDDALAESGYRICFMAEYFLPDVRCLQKISCGYETKLLLPEDFASYYLPQWSNALCRKRKHLDMLAVGAFEDDRLIGLAGASADGDSMWQIGVDVLPEHRGHGVAAAITAGLALEILQRDKVPFYCAAWSNIPSVRNAIRSGFRPAWVEMTAKPESFVNGLNHLSEVIP